MEAREFDDEKLQKASLLVNDLNEALEIQKLNPSLAYG
jgi:hypothetical protein